MVLFRAVTVTLAIIHLFTDVWLLFTPLCQYKGIELIMFSRQQHHLPRICIRIGNIEQNMFDTATMNKTVFTCETVVVSVVLLQSQSVVYRQTRQLQLQDQIILSTMDSTVALETITSWIGGQTISDFLFLTDCVTTKTGMTLLLFNESPTKHLASCFFTMPCIVKTKKKSGLLRDLLLRKRPIQPVPIFYVFMQKYFYFNLFQLSQCL